MRHGACRGAQKQQRRAGVWTSAASGGQSERSAPGRYLQLRADVDSDLGTIEIDEVATL